MTVRPAGLVPVLLALSAATAAAQVIPNTAPDTTPRGVARTGWIFGYSGITGGQWDPTGFEVARAFAVGSGPGRLVFVGGRLGAWIGEIGFVEDGTHGLFVGLLAGYRQPLLTLLEVGTSERDLSYALLTGTLEFSANADRNAPTPDEAHLTAAFLLGLSYGERAPVDESFAVLAGPVLFVGGRSTDVRLQIGLRFQAPTGRR